MSRALLPTDATLAGWKNVAEALHHYGVTEGDWRALATRLGDETLDDLVLFAGIAHEDVRREVQTLGLTPVQQTRLWLVFNASRVRFGLPFADWIVPSAGPGVLAVGAEAGVGAVGAYKIKVSTLLDQTSDVETCMLPHAKLLELRRNYHTRMGDNPMAVEEVTDTQLSAFYQWLHTHGQPPVVDFAIWAPHGARVERRLKFASQ
eukprot:6458523-Amphidinium_carterae.1